MSKWGVIGYLEMAKKMKKILILNGSHSEISMIQEAKKLGYYVITTGSMPKLPGHSYADEYIPGDYSDKEAMLAIAGNHAVDAVVSCANDFGILSAAYVGEKMGLLGHDSYETTLLLHEKDRFKHFALAHKLQVPYADTYHSLEAAQAAVGSHPYPLIVKPVDLTGGKGVRKVDTDQEYKEAVQNAFAWSRKKRVVAEQFIQGTYHSFSTFLVSRKVAAYFSDKEYPFLNPYFVATSTSPAAETHSVKDILIGQAEKCARLLQLTDGVFHMQYVMDKRNVPYIIDITRRCSGDLYPEPVEHSTGIPWAKWIVMAEAGFSGDNFTERGSQNKYCGRHCIMAEQNGIIEDVMIADELKKNIYKKVEWWQKGDIISNYLSDKCGVLFWEFDTREEMEDKAARVRELVKVVTM